MINAAAIGIFFVAACYCIGYVYSFAYYGVVTNYVGWLNVISLDYLKEGGYYLATNPKSLFFVLLFAFVVKLYFYNLSFVHRCYIVGYKKFLYFFVSSVGTVQKVRGFFDRSEKSRVYIWLLYARAPFKTIIPFLPKVVEHGAALLLHFAFFSLAYASLVMFAFNVLGKSVSDMAGLLNSDRQDLVCIKSEEKCMSGLVIYSNDESYVVYEGRGFDGNINVIDKSEIRKIVLGWDEKGRKAFGKFNEEMLFEGALRRSREAGSMSHY